MIRNNSQIGTEPFLDSRVRIVRLDSMPPRADVSSISFKEKGGSSRDQVVSTISSPRLEQRSFLRSIEAVLREMLALPDNELAALYAESVLLRGGPTDEAKVQGTNRNQTTVAGVPGI